MSRLKGAVHRVIASSHPSIADAAREATARNRETIALFLRADRELPATFGFPHTDGSLASNFEAFVEQNHPLVSIFLAHPLHPFTRFERAVVWACTLVFNLFVNLVTERTSLRTLAGLAPLVAGDSRARVLLAKHAVIFAYSLLIRTMVILPCCVADALAHKLEVFDADARASARAAHLSDRARRLKDAGDATLHALGIVHGTMLIVGSALAVFADGDAVLSMRRVALDTLTLEALNVSVLWFAKFAPLFLVLFPLHRAQWYTGGAAADYACGRRSLWGYADSPAFVAGLHCVRPVIDDDEPAHVYSPRAGGFYHRVEPRDDDDDEVPV